MFADILVWSMLAIMAASSAAVMAAAILRGFLEDE